MAANAPCAAALRSASGKTMFADFPPSSRVSFLMLGALAVMILRPVSVDPVNETFATLG